MNECRHRDNETLRLGPGVYWCCSCGSIRRGGLHGWESPKWCPIEGLRRHVIRAALDLLGAWEDGSKTLDFEPLKRAVFRYPASYLHRVREILEPTPEPEGRTTDAN